MVVITVSARLWASLSCGPLEDWIYDVRVRLSSGVSRGFVLLHRGINTPLQVERGVRVGVRYLLGGELVLSYLVNVKKKSSVKKVSRATAAFTLGSGTVKGGGRKFPSFKSSLVLHFVFVEGGGISFGLLVSTVFDCILCVVFESSLFFLFHEWQCHRYEGARVVRVPSPPLSLPLPPIRECKI